MGVDVKYGFRPDQENSVYIGAGVTFRGAISAPDQVIVDGEIAGEVTARAVSLGQSGAIRGRVTATSADVSGSLTEEIEIRQLLIVRATGRIEGNVRYGEIQLEKGGILTGDLSPIDDYRPSLPSSSSQRPVGAEPASEAPPLEADTQPLTDGDEPVPASGERVVAHDAVSRRATLFGAPRLRLFTRRS